MDGARADIAVIEATGAAVPPGPTAETRPEPPPLIASSPIRFTLDILPFAAIVLSALVLASAQIAQAGSGSSTSSRSRSSSSSASDRGAWSASAASCSKPRGSTSDELAIALAQRAEADSRYQTLVERVPAAVYIDVADDAVTDGGHLAYLSPQIEAILGYAPQAFIDDPELWPSLTHPEDRAKTVSALADHWTTGLPLRIDYRMIAADGSTVWVHDEAYAMRDESTGGRRVSQGLLVDTTEQKRLEAQLLHDAFHDPLTGLANRALFREHLDRTLERAATTPALGRGPVPRHRRLQGRQRLARARGGRSPARRGRASPLGDRARR